MTFDAWWSGLDKWMQNKIDYESASRGWTAAIASEREQMECGHPTAMLNIHGAGKPSSRSDVYCVACEEVRKLVEAAQDMLAAISTGHPALITDATAGLQTVVAPYLPQPKVSAE